MLGEIRRLIDCADSPVTTTGGTGLLKGALRVSAVCSTMVATRYTDCRSASWDARRRHRVCGSPTPSTEATRKRSFCSSVSSSARYILILRGRTANISWFPTSLQTVPPQRLLPADCLFACLTSSCTFSTHAVFRQAPIFLSGDGCRVLEELGCPPGLRLSGHRQRPAEQSRRSPLGGTGSRPGERLFPVPVHREPEPTLRRPGR
jgi:hypothetical protein